MKKLFSLSYMIVLLVLFLSACGGSQSSGPVTIRYAIWDKNQASAMQQIINEFQKAHPGISVKSVLSHFAQRA